ncbi:MAG: DUF4328 domain-containing protein [Gordonia sp. (in: high G+C Gram-positive bacteria)]
MLDLCPRCRIQAPHKPGRQRCPRCGGPLRTVGSAAEAAAIVAGNVPAGNLPVRYGPAAPPRPAPQMYHSRPVRWVARRPADTLPPPRRPRWRGPRLIPRYPYLPRWGLVDKPVVADAAETAPGRLGTALVAVFRYAAYAFALSALAHLLRYVLLVVNRTTTLPPWLIWVSGVAVPAGGLLALGGLVAATVVFTRWVLAIRAREFRHAGFADPRPRWRSSALAAIPLVNLVGAPLLLAEAAAVSGPDRTLPASFRERLTPIWVAWALVHVLAGAAWITWFVGRESGSIQTGANALGLIVLTSAVSAVFAVTAGPRLAVLFDAAEAATPARRWVVAG